MKTDVKNGQGSKVEPTQTKDTSKGAGAMAIVQANKETVTTPIQDRLKKLNEAQKLVDRRKKLVDASDTVNLFEEGLDGEDDVITLESGKGGKVRSLEITKPDAVKKVVELLKTDLQTALKEVDAKLLTATI